MVPEAEEHVRIEALIEVASRDAGRSASAVFNPFAGIYKAPCCCSSSVSEAEAVLIAGGRAVAGSSFVASCLVSARDGLRGHRSFSSFSFPVPFSAVFSTRHAVVATRRNLSGHAASCAPRAADSPSAPSAAAARTRVTSCTLATFRTRVTSCTLADVS